VRYLRNIQAVRPVIRRNIVETYTYMGHTKRKLPYKEGLGMDRDNALGIWGVRCIEYGTSLLGVICFNFLRYQVGDVACVVEPHI
jgi:hypothetical protein